MLKIDNEEDFFREYRKRFDIPTVTLHQKLKAVHNPKSKEICDFLYEVDFANCGNFFRMNDGSTKESREMLMSLLDLYFKKNKQKCNADISLLKQKRKKKSKIKVKPIIDDEDTQETYVAYVMFDKEANPLSAEHYTAESVLKEMTVKYTIEQLKEQGNKLCKMLCTAEKWVECLEVIDY